MSLRIKIVATMLFVATLVATTIVVAAAASLRRTVLHDFQTFTRSVAGTTAISLDARALARIRTNKDAEGFSFQAVRSLLERSRAVNGLRQEEIYILRPLSEGSFETEFVVMLHDQPFVGSRYEIVPLNRDAFRRAIETGEPQATALYHDDHGQWISAYQALRDETGALQGVLEVDARVDRYLTELQCNLWNLITLGGAGLLAGMIPGLILAVGLTRGLNRLRDRVVRFQKGDHQSELQLRTGDELESLASVFNEMLLGLREKLALLPFVSRFTAEAVRRSRDNPTWLSGVESEVCVLFGDLRGFTRFSESRDAAELVQRLNRILAVQADVVISMGGDVDKFIGDEIMAVFMPEDEGVARAVRCAARMIAAVQTEIDGLGDRLGLGIGIHTGPAVLGAIGSDARRDFTAIGHTVNVASRLCDHASAWEILISDQVFKRLPPEERAGFDIRPPLALKNVAQAPQLWGRLHPLTAPAPL